MLNELFLVYTNPPSNELAIVNEQVSPQELNNSSGNIVKIIEFFSS